VGFLVRVIPYQDTSAFLGGFYPNGFVGTDFIVRNGQLLKNGDLPVGSRFSQGIYYSTSDLFLFIHASMLSIVGGGGTGRSLAEFFRWFLWEGLILFPLAVIFAVNSIAKAAGTRLHPATHVVVLAFGSFLGWNVIYLTSVGLTNAPFGWSIILIVVGLLVRPTRNLVATRGLALGLASLSMTFYHTDAAVILIVLLCWLFVQGKSRNRRLTVGMLTAYVVTYLTYLVYISVGFFDSYLSALALASQTLFGGGNTPVAQDIGVFSIPLWWRVPALACYATLGIGYLWFVLSLRKLPGRSPGLVAALTMVMSFPLIFSAFALFGYVEAIGRMLLYAFVFCPVVLAYLGSRAIWTGEKRTVAAISMTIVVLSAGLFVTTPTIAATTISLQEESAGFFLMAHSGAKTVVFTDYRVGSIFTSNGWFNAVGIWSTDPSNQTITALNTIYYGQNADAALSALGGYTSFGGHRPRFLLFSTQMASNTVGISAGGVTYRAAGLDFRAKFDNNPNFALVFDSGQTQIYAVETPGW
jgi:hypothetical protein